MSQGPTRRTILGTAVPSLAAANTPLGGDGTALTSNVLAERFMPPRDRDEFVTAGFSAPGDGGGATFVLVEPGFKAAVVFRSQDGRAWTIMDAMLDARMFGCLMEGGDVTPAFVFALKASVALNRALTIPAGMLTVGDVVLPDGLSLWGAASGQTILRRADGKRRCISDAKGSVDIRDVTFDGASTESDAPQLDDSTALRCVAPGSRINAYRVKCIRSSGSGLFQASGYLFADELECSDNLGSGCRLHKPISAYLTRLVARDNDHSGFYADGDNARFSLSDRDTWFSSKLGKVELVSPEVVRVRNRARRGSDSGQSGNGIHGYLLSQFHIIDPIVTETEHSSIRAARCDSVFVCGGELTDAGDTGVYVEFGSHRTRIVGTSARPQGQLRNGHLAIERLAERLLIRCSEAVFVPEDQGRDLFAHGARVEIGQVRSSSELVGILDPLTPLCSMERVPPGEWSIGMRRTELIVGTSDGARQLKTGFIFTNVVSEDARPAILSGLHARAGTGILVEGFATVTGCVCEADVVGIAAALVPGAGEHAGGYLSINGNLIYDPKSAKTLKVGIATSTPPAKNASQFISLGMNHVSDAQRPYSGSFNRSVIDPTGNLIDLPGNIGSVHLDSGSGQSRDFETLSSHSGITSSEPVMVECGRFPLRLNEGFGSFASGVHAVAFLMTGRERSPSHSEFTITVDHSGHAGSVLCDRRPSTSSVPRLCVFESKDEYVVAIEVPAPSTFTISSRYLGPWTQALAGRRSEGPGAVLHQCQPVCTAQMKDVTARWVTVS